MSAQTHRSDPRILTRRTLERDYPRLTHLLRPGLAVLDVGCGTGSITGGIAAAVAPAGHVIGIDRDESLLEIARQDHAAVPNLAFQKADALSMQFERTFDLVTAARVLQWIDRPDQALARMAYAAKSGGRVAVLDYNHLNNSWQPEPPAEFKRFYHAFLEWRAANSWDNLLADHLPELFRAGGMVEVQVFADDEVTQRGGAEATVWVHVIETVGVTMVAAGFLRDEERLAAHGAYRDWTESRLERQTLELRTVVGSVSLHDARLGKAI
jgi:ubiquinone/menaquinone biosynthesis C-methylase UbiE